MSDKQVVLAVFGDEAAADAAVNQVKSWDKATDEIKLSSIGVLVMDDRGKIKTHKMGARSTGKGAGIGLILVMLTPVGLVAGTVGAPCSAGCIVRGSVWTSRTGIASPRNWNGDARSSASWRRRSSPP